MSGKPQTHDAETRPAGRLKRLRARWEGRILGCVIYAVAATLRAKILFADREASGGVAGSGQTEEIGRIYSLWHGRMLYPAFFRRNREASVLVSYSLDGERLAGALSVLGYRTVRGSSSRGGATALRHLLKALRSGRDVGIASDGPRGPALHVQPGIIQLASRSGAPILPLVFGAARAKTFSSWDRFCLPRPFARVALVFGKPVRVPREGDDTLLETKRRELETEMHWALEAADAAARGAPLPPEPSAESGSGRVDATS